MNKRELCLGNFVRVTKPGGYNNVGDIICVKSISDKGINHWQDMGASGENTWDGIEGIEFSWEIFEAIGAKRSHLDSGVLDAKDCQYVVRHYGWGWGIEGWYFKYLHQFQNHYFFENQEDFPLDTFVRIFNVKGV